MFLRYFYDDKLAQASYLVGCQQTGEAIVIDPARNVAPYLQLAAANGLRITAAAETHIHADFLSGVRELAAHGATLYLSDEGGAGWQYTNLQNIKHVLLNDGSHFMIGNLRFDVLHTPGHTPEHISFLLTDTKGADRPMGIFTGDFVFAGDVGRPDLLEKAAHIVGTMESGARQMFESLQRFRDLPDYLQVWPGHGAGSACGKALGAVPSTTVGYEKMFNPALQYDDQTAFMEWLLSEQPEPPLYFGMMKQLNRDGAALAKDAPAPQRLTTEAVIELLDKGTEALFVDTRRAREFAGGHLPGTINIPHDNSFVTWAGWLLPYDRPFYLLIEEDSLPDVLRDLQSIGLDNVGGYCTPDVLAAWQAAGRDLQTYESRKPNELAALIDTEAVTLLDVRGQSEWDAGHIPGARHVMLGYLREHLDELPRDKPIVVQCQAGARSAIAASLLQARGFAQVINMNGGYTRWASANLPTTERQPERSPTV